MRGTFFRAWLFAVPALALPAALMFPAALMLPAARAQEVPTAPITTDTLEYCITLQQMVVQRGSRLPDVKRLMDEGRRMCDHGEIRMGIARLREALILSRHHIEPPPAEAQY